MPKAIVDVVVGLWEFIKRFCREFYTLLKFRGREFDERLQVKYSSMVRAIIWLGIVLAVLGVLLLVLSLASNFFFNLLNWADRMPKQENIVPSLP